jgi:DNA-binding MarR family transcriptional regulator
MLALLEQCHALRRWLEYESKRVAGLSFSQLHALGLINASGGQRTVTGLAASLSRTGQTATSLADSLERQGLVRRKRLREGDRRQVWLTLTAKGRESLRTAESAVPRMGADAIDGLKRLPGGEESLRAAVATVRDMVPSSD